MNSNILNMMGIDGIDPAIFFIVLIVLCLILFLIAIVQGRKINKQAQRIDNLCNGKDGESLEDKIVKILNDNARLLSMSRQNKEAITILDEKLRLGYQKLGIVRYDAFHQMGGRLSFAIAMLNMDNNGFILNSVHSAEGSYVYTKEIYDGACELELGDEEQEALTNAINSIQ